MEKKEAFNLIDKTFNAKFDIEQYTLFLRNLLNSFDEEKERDWAQGNYIYESFREHINKFKCLGVFTDPEGVEVELLVIETKNTTKLERARTSLRNFVIKRLNDKNREYALAAFYSKEDNGADWRFSFIKIEHEAYKDDKGKVKTKKDLTPAKRFSFLVGEHEHSYTAQKQLLPLLQNDYSNPTAEDIEKGFSIEKVTAEFFEQYKELYLKLAEHFTNETTIQNLLSTNNIETARFTKKLLGQIVFLYFLQKKGWLGVPKNEPWGKGDRKFLQTLFQAAINEGKNFFKDYLQFLFYEALAKARTQIPDPSYYKRFDCKIPFLNGGLFEADYPWETANLSIPNELFRNEEKNMAGDKGAGVLDVFDRYNFTIKEDEPLEKEVAVDPEMLGKVFENMLEITERKSKGAFYTPREIVHYMCQESLIHYIDNSVNYATESFHPIDSDQLQIFGGTTDKKGQRKIEIEHKGKIIVPKSDIETFIHKGFLAAENDLNIITKGKETETYRFQIPETIRQNADIIDEKLTNIKICDPAIGSGAFPVGILHELVTAQKVLLPYLSHAYLEKKLKQIELAKSDFNKDKEKYYYRIKRHAIQESIYGVDIDASAIDIARLRLWLSLIVDEEDFYSIEALPNLDYKIVKGNSLIGFPEEWQSIAFDKIEKLKELFFNETNSQRKKELKKEIDKEIIERLSASKRVFGYDIDFDFKLLFSEVWHYRKGFDIVIGNPPYDVYEGKRKDEIETIEKIKIFEKAKGGKYNAYKLFLAKAVHLQNCNSILCMIFQNSFLADNSAKNIRNHFLIEEQIIKIDSFPERDDLNKRVFKQVKMSVCILTSNKRRKDNYDFELNIWEEREMLNCKRANFNNNETLNLDATTYAIPSISQEELFVLKKLSKNVRLQSIANCFQGEINLSTNKKHLTLNPSSNTKPLIKGAGIQKWFFPKKMSQGEIEYVYFKEFLKENKGKRTQHHTIRRIVTQGITGVDEKSRIKGNILEPGIFCGHSVNYIIFKNKKTDLNYFLALLNSEILNWYFKAFSTNSNVNSYEINGLPIVPDTNISSSISICVDYLRTLFQIYEKNEGSIFKEYYNAIINGVCYELYFPNELKQAKKEIIKHLGSLKAIDKSMSDEKKLAIIQSEFNRLYDPNHIVRNNIETLDSIEEVRIIKESLK